MKHCLIGGALGAAAAEFCAIAFRTSSLRGMTDNYDTYDGVGRW